MYKKDNILVPVDFVTEQTSYSKPINLFDGKKIRKEKNKIILMT